MVSLLSVSNNCFGLFNANFAIGAIVLFQEFFVAITLIAEAEQLLEEEIDEACNSASTGYASQSDGDDLAVVGGLFLFDEKHNFASF